ASDFPLPATSRRLARRSNSANGTPCAAPSAFTKIRPPSNASSSVLRFANVDPGVVVATVCNDAMAASAAPKTAGTPDWAALEPPESGPAGSDVSPSATSTLSSGTPVLRDELREDRVRAGADVLRRAADAGRAVVAELDASLGGEPRGDPRAPGH